MNALVRRAIARGKSRQTIRRLLMLEALEYLPPAREETAVRTPPEADGDPRPDRGLAARLEREGWRPYRAPSVACLVRDLECYEGGHCAACWQPALVGTGLMRGTHYALLLECQECGHQECV